MVTAEVEASTLDKYQEPNKIEHLGFRYFPFQGKATQSSGIVKSNAIPLNYTYLVNNEAESATAFLTPDVGQRPVIFSSDESTYKQIMLVAGRDYAMQSRIRTHFNLDVLDTVSTLIPQISTGDLSLEQSVLDIFDAYQHEEFDIDIAHDFTNALDSLIRANGKPVIRIINHLIKNIALNKDIISEILKALGRIEDEITKEARYELLIGLIKDESAIIRDGAVSGLSFLDDKRALTQLRILFEIETVPILKNNIKVAIKGLET